MAGGQNRGIAAGDFLRRAADALEERAETHGEMRRNHANVALLFSTYLQLLGHPVKLKPSDAAAMLQLLKLARMHEGAYNDDDDVDNLGYGAITGQLRAIEEEERAGTAEAAVLAAINAENEKREARRAADFKPPANRRRAR
jgi:hypothetical protein